MTDKPTIDVVMDKALKAPFPYFGGKGMVADKVWSYLGDVKQYIEPFFGSGAVLLRRPPTKLDKFYEIVNDKDGFVANVWRSIAFSPDEVARWCDWPVNHADLNARRKILIKNEGYLINNLQNDPEWHDAKLAGYWVWAASCWIGGGLTRPNAIPHLACDKGITSQRPHLTGDMGITSQRPHIARDAGITSQRPHLTCDMGITSKRPHLTDDKGIYECINALSRRLRYVKVVCGDWSRVCGGNWQDNNKPVGIFFDPPYATSGRDEAIYQHDSMTVAKDVEVWCLERGKNQSYRIVVAGYDDEYKTLLDNGWIFEAWSARGSMNRHRERLFISPHCLKEKKGLFDVGE
jgi:site-specific DNA-adenine methylase